MVHAEIEITHVCGLGCEYCITPNINTPDPQELTIEQWKKGIDNLERIGVTHFTFMGGEVTRKKDVEELVKHINTKKSMDYIFLTNGFVSDAIIQKLLDAGVRNIGVSIDSIYEERPQGKICSNEVKSYQGLKMLRFFKEKGVQKLIATVVVTKKNLHNLLFIYEKLHAEGFYMNITALQWLKYGGKKFDGVFHDEDRAAIGAVMKQLIDIKKKTSNTLVNSVSYFENFVDYSIDQHFKCKEVRMLGFYPDGTLNYCVGQVGQIGSAKDYNILTLTPKNYQRFLEDWRFDKEGNACLGCTFSCRDRSGDFNSADEQYPNIWFKGWNNGRDKYSTSIY